MDNVELEAEKIMAKGSKSFYLASRFFPRELMVGSSLIYYWCRHCDDVIDDGGSDSNLSQLKSHTEEVWSHSPDLPLPFLALRKVSSQFQIPSFYPMELLEGMAMDDRNETYANFNELRIYCYRVASTVGLMMGHVMGLFDKSALKQAAHMGIAMQLTNIARDVKEDYERGRLYLPQDWLASEQLNSANYFDEENRARLFQVVKRLLNEAESYYESGMSGLVSLPWRSAFTVLIAANFYREIGRLILRKGEKALSSRTIVPGWRKVFIVFKCMALLVGMLPARMIRPREKVTIDYIWRLE